MCSSDLHSLGDSSLLHFWKGPLRIAALTAGSEHESRQYQGNQGSVETHSQDSVGRIMTALVMPKAQLEQESSHRESTPWADL